MTGGLESLLCCPSCGADIKIDASRASCGAHSFPVTNGIARLLPEDLMRLRGGEPGATVRGRTYSSFGFEWQRFGSHLPSYALNFAWYREPLGNVDLAGRTVLDAGCGMGRHTREFLKEGARVVAVDASPAIDVAARNNPSGAAVFVQGDILNLPVRRRSVDVACCLGVLHHLEDTEAGLRKLLMAVKPGGRILLYLYHDPAESSSVRGVLIKLVSVLRTLTTRMPLRVLHPFSAVIAAALYVAYVAPMKLISRLGVGRVRTLPLGQYIDYPFRVFWNDQFDRFSAPLEKRYSRAAVEDLLARVGLTEVRILGGYGWRAAARVP